MLGLHTLIYFHPHWSKLSPLHSFPFPSLTALLPALVAVTQSISRLWAQHWGRRAVSQAVWCRAEGLMRVSERRSPTFPRRLAAGRACGGGFASFSRPLRFLRSSGSYSFPARKQPSPATAEVGVGGGGEEEGGAEEFGFKMSPRLGTASHGLKS